MIRQPGAKKREFVPAKGGRVERSKAMNPNDIGSFYRAIHREVQHVKSRITGDFIVFRSTFKLQSVIRLF